ncbi:hypothetical protein OBK15_07270 [Empedobacter falsenii]
MCSNCSDKLIKYVKTKNGNQRYKCKNCQKTSVEIYHYNAYLSTINFNIIQLTKEGLGIRSTARYLQISPTTLLKRLLEIASKNHLNLRTHLKRLNKKTIYYTKNTAILSAILTIYF